MGNADQRNSKSQLFFAAVWVLITFSLVVTTQLAGVTGAAGNDRSTISGLVDFPLVGADPSAEELPSVLYGGIMWSLVEVRVVKADGLLEKADVEVDLRATNTLEATSVRASSDMVALVDTTGATGLLPGRLAEVGLRLGLEPGQSIEVTAEFEVGFTASPNPDQLAIQIGEPNRIPVVLPLTGQPEPSQYPVLMAVESVPATVADPDVTSRSIVIEPQAASLDINAATYRAAEGQRLAVVKVNVQRAEESDRPGYLAEEFWALKTGQGESVAPILVTRTDRPQVNTDEVTILFVFSGPASKLSLVADATGDQAEFSIVVPKG